MTSFNTTFVFATLTQTACFLKSVGWSVRPWCWSIAYNDQARPFQLLLIRLKTFTTSNFFCAAIYWLAKISEGLHFCRAGHLPGPCSAPIHFVRRQSTVDRTARDSSDQLADGLPLRVPPFARRLTPRLNDDLRQDIIEELRAGLVSE